MTGSAGLLLLRMRLVLVVPLEPSPVACKLCHTSLSQPAATTVTATTMGVGPIRAPAKCLRLPHTPTRPRTHTPLTNRIRRYLLTMELRQVLTEPMSQRHTLDMPARRYMALLINRCMVRCQAPVVPA